MDQRNWADRRIATPAGTLVLREEGPEDAEFRFRLFRLSRGAAWDALASAPAFEPLMRQQFAAQNAALAACLKLIVATATGEPIGRLALAGGDSPRLADIALLPETRGRGFGAALIAAAQAEARRRALPLRLSVARDNPGAARLYRRLGFMDCGGDAVYAEMIWRA
ncbi:GNAT family N-acetyltransferase [Rhodoblastus sp.]|uniref:GNAT family N-acetyltransferase n=1 Tax=Rhodoblastus sp. TaxID=1962975 RepID=UPI003F9B0C1C